MLHPTRILALLVGILAAASASQVEDLRLISPINGKPFQASIPTVAVMVGNTEGSTADLGIDVDGCRHTTGISEYDLLIVVDPHTYFAAQAAEWDRTTGRFFFPLPPDMATFVGKELNTQFQLDWHRAFGTAKAVAQRDGQPPPAPEQFVMNQAEVPTHVRFRNALLCYKHRGASDLTLGQVANMGAWAMRVYLNRPIISPEFAGGIQEVNHALERRLGLDNAKQGQVFDLAKVSAAFAAIRQGQLTREGRIVADLTYLGYQLRDGDMAQVLRTLEEMKERNTKRDEKLPMLFAGLVREREAMITQHYVYLTRTAAVGFSAAVGREQVNRRRLPTVMMSVAESFRRIGELERARDWYLALARMPETQPALRAQLRAQSGRPGNAAPPALHLGWLADEALDRLKAGGLAIEAFGPMDRELLTEVVTRNLGHSSYDSAWKPTTGGTGQQLERVLSETGKAVMDVALRSGAWPATLGELWDNGAVRNWDSYNRFRCPISGEPLRYTAPRLPLQSGAFAPTTVLVATAKRVTGPSGRLQHAAFLLNGTLRWVDAEVAPLQVLAASGSATVAAAGP